MRSVILLLLAITLAFTPNVSYAQEEPEIFPWFVFLPLLSARPVESFVIVEDYQALVKWLQQWGIEAPPENQVNAADTSTFKLNCKEGEPAYAAFRVGPGSMSSIFSLQGMPSIDTLRQSNCPTNSCMGAHVWHGAKGVTVLSHVVYGVFSAGHLFAGCV